MSRLSFFNVPNKISDINDKLVFYSVIEKTNPVIIFYNTGKIHELEELRHDHDTIDNLNTLGLDIYLYEPLTGYKKNMSTPSLFYSEYTGHEQLDEYRAEELDSIEIYVKNNNLNNVTVHACDYNVEKYYGFNYNSLKILNDNVYIKTVYGDITDKKYNNIAIEKKFICLSWRYTHHKHLISSFLADKSSYISWFYNRSIDWDNIPYINIDRFKAEGSDLFSIIEKGSDTLKSKVPLRLDVDMNDTEVINNRKPIPEYIQYIRTTSPTYIDYYFHRSFCAIVTETRFAQPTGDISEKTFKCIVFNTPFILVAPPKSLEYLKSFGYKTFSDFWDESYDDEFDHYKRLIKLLSIINKLDNLTIDELSKMKDDMTPILEFNKNLFLQQKTTMIHKVTNYKYRRNKHVLN